MGQSLQVYHHRSFSRWSKQPALFLYTEARHLKLQSPTGWHFFELRNKASIAARIAIHVSAGVATSPYRAPFGSFEICRSITMRELTNFLESILNNLRKLGVQEFTIYNFPELYDRRNAGKVTSVLYALGFSLRKEVNSIVPVNPTPFERIIKISERQKLRKSQQVFHFSQVDQKEYKRLYLFIERSRHARKQSLSMTANALQKVITAFPERFYLFKVSNNQDTAAAAIVIQVTPKTLYTFYYAHDSRFNPISPTVMLLAGVYEFARKRKMKQIDLGTSMLDAKVNRTLLHFKRSVGGISNDRMVFQKQLS